MNSNPSLVEVIDDVDSKTVKGFCKSSNPMQFVASFCHINYNSDNQNLKHTVFAVMKDTAKNFVMPIISEEILPKIPDYFLRDLPEITKARAAKTTNFSTLQQGL